MMECILRILYDEDVVDKASNDKWKASISKETYRVLIGWFRFVSCD